MGKKELESGDPLSRCTFFCKSCREQFEREPDRVEGAPEREWHPWAYFAACPTCGEEGSQAGWEQKLFKAWCADRTPESLAASTKNLEGHPTPEETRRTRFNALKHGLRARTATFFPARPGGYPHCNRCEHLETRGCEPVGACLKRMELFLKHHIAFERKDPNLLMELRSDLHANVQAIINDIVLAIIQDGVRIETPQWYHDKDGYLHLAEYQDEIGQKRLITEMRAHPLLKVLGEMIARNSLSLSDMGMTPRVQDDQELLGGHLEAKREELESSAEFQRRQAEAMEGLREKIERSRKRLAGDPVLLEHEDREA